MVASIGYGGKLLLLQTVLSITGLYLRWWVGAAKPGVPRLILVAPIVAVNFLVPRIFDFDTDTITVGYLYLFVCWISRLQAPTSGDDGSVRKSNARSGQSAGTTVDILLGMLGKIGMMVLSYFVLPNFNLPLLVREHWWGMGIYWMLATSLDAMNLLVKLLGGVNCSPHFDHPYRSTSLMDWWSRRWNLVVSNMLRATVYDPISEGRLVPSDKPFKFSKVRSAVAVCATFLVSGIAHEMLLRAIVPDARKGQYIICFGILGPLTVLESMVMRWGRKRGLSLPTWLRIIYAFETFFTVAHFFFLPVVHEHKLAPRLLTQLLRSFKATFGSGA